MNWIKIGNRTRTYQLNSEPELIHIIKTGYHDTYMVVFEDGYENVGDLKIYTEQEIYEDFGIILEDWITEKDIQNSYKIENGNIN